ncbi:unnamed protein product [Ectocarpus sp. 13 AM-2016]
MIAAAAKPRASGVRSLVRGRDGNAAGIRALSAASLASSYVSGLQAPPLTSAVTSSAAVSGLQAFPAWTNSRRGMSSSRGGKGSDTAGPPGTIKGFGRRQKPVDAGNTALGKGFDLMEDDPDSRKKVVIGGYDPHGFQLGDGVDVRGSMICMPNSFVLWQPKRPSDITVESLRIVELVIPKIDLIIVGVGERMTARLDPVLVKHLASKGIRVEQMDTVNACSTFNVLNAEDRRVAAALLQLSPEEESILSK